MMKILILGAKGTLGQDLVKIFSKDNEVFDWDKEELDITNEKEVYKKIIDLSPDVVINAAAYNAVDKAEIEKDRADLINGYAPGYIAKVAQKMGAIFIHYSSDYVFDGQNKSGYKENDIPAPLSNYGKSKLLGEERVQKNSEKYYIIRLSRLFGHEGGGKKSFVDLMLKIASEENEIEVIDEEISSPTYSFDLAKKTKEIIEQKIPFGIYHITNSGSCSWYGFAKEIFTISKNNVRLKAIKGESLSRPAKRPAYSVLLNTKLSPMRSWQEALRGYIKNKI